MILIRLARLATAGDETFVLAEYICWVRERMSPGGLRGLQINPNGLVERFIASCYDGLSARILDNYRGYLRLANVVVSLNVSSQDIQRFLATRRCTNGGKHAYFRILPAFYNWLLSPKSSPNLKPQDNPILIVEAPKVEQKTLPSITREQLEYVVEQASRIRDKAIISLFADSGLRLSELANIKGS